MARKPYPQFNRFRDFVVDELNERRRDDSPTPISSPFVRLTSCLQEMELGYVFFTLGLHGFEASSDLDIFAQSYGKSKDIVGYAYDMKRRSNGKLTKYLVSTDMITVDDFTFMPKGALTGNQLTKVQADRADKKELLNTSFAGGAHPIPGVTQVSVRQRGIGTPAIASVTWRCYNRSQLEFLRHHFLTAGNYVVVEYGQQFSNRQVKKMLDFGDDSVRRTLADAVMKGRLGMIKDWIEPNNGNYDFIVGRVGNFTVDIDARSGVYTCTTTIVGMGEQMYGISTDTTFVSSQNQDQTEQTALRTIHDYFTPGLRFDQLVASNANDATLVAAPHVNWAQQGTQQNVTDGDTRKLKDTSFYPEDFHFVSWKFFCTKLLPEVFNLIESDFVRNDLHRISQFYHENQADYAKDEHGNDIPPEQQEWIGNNPLLKSCEPDTMVLIKKNMDLVPPPLQGAGTFEDSPGANDYRGRLDHGMWLNTEMIRQCFIDAMSFFEAIKGVLARLNRASADYWCLQLFWDEELGVFRIIDLGFVDGTNMEQFWRFNESTHGECLDIKFDSAFPKELVAQMMLFAKFKNESRATQEELLKKYPMIGTTSAFMFSVNYTNYKDILGDEIDTLRKGKDKPTSDAEKLGARAPEDRANPTASSRVAGLNLSPATGVASNANTPQRGQEMKQPTAALSDQTSKRDATQVDAIRSSTKALPVTINPNKISRNLNDPRIDPEFRANLRLLMADIRARGHTVEIVEAYREQVRQLFLYTQGRNGTPGPQVTHTVNSNHTKGLACDLMIDGSDAATLKFFPTLSEICPKYNLKTIGEWDYDHVEAIGADKVPSPRNTDYVHGENTAANQDNPAVNPDSPEVQAQKQKEAEAEAAQVSSVDIASRFGRTMLSVIEPTPSALKNKITTHGYANYPNPNNFVIGLPLTTKVGVSLLGISGISISDGFYVDKLPFIFEKYGVFQVTEMTQEITEKGWMTSITGIYRYLWVDGKPRHSTTTTVSA
jgi:uncharacterized protein YcbK (DUF882 family)